MNRPLKCCMLMLVVVLEALYLNVNAQSSHQVQWIIPSKARNEVNSWLAFRKVINLSNKPVHIITKIAADSKYWLWINEKLVVFEGSLKRGPDPENTYYDEIDLAPYVRKGKNTVAVLVWYFGKEGFSHKSSGKAGLYIESQVPSLNSNKTWKASQLDAYQTAAAPLPNYRLPNPIFYMMLQKE